ncbi:MAG TPA: hypothetical protein VGQ71_06320 [Terriglobales bacterium]|nr:hypothetical protein [Terriglobales bacterium]
MSAAAPVHTPTVCLLSSHALLISEFQGMAYKADFQLRAKFLNPHMAFDVRALQLPHDAVYAVDARPSRAETQSLVSDLLAQFPGSHVMVLAGNFPESTAFPLLALGVRGLLRHSDVRQQLPLAVRSIAAGGFWVPRTLLERFVESAVGSTLRSRFALERADLGESEAAVLDGVVQNLSDAQIAKKLLLEQAEVERQVTRLLARFGVRRRADLILLGIQPSPQ